MEKVKVKKKTITIVIDDDNIPTWKEIEVSEKLLKHSLTCKEYMEAYEKWIPANDIPFEKLFKMVLSTDNASNRLVENVIIRATCKFNHFQVPDFSLNYNSRLKK